MVFKMAKEGTYSPKSIAHMKEHCTLVKRYIGDSSLYEMTSTDVRDIALQMASEGLAVSTQKSYIFALKSMLKFVKNPAHTTRIVFQADTRPKVDWLSVDQAHALLQADCLSSAEYLAVVLALCMGLRRVEIVRLRMRDICVSEKYITVIGKGPRGGKLRLVPFHPRFIPALESYLKTRARYVSMGRNTPPDNVFIWYSRQDHRTCEYNAVKGSGMDGLIRRASRKMGFHFSAHTLRRTFGRLMWLSGVPVVTIAKILGHSSTEQTLQYIGANLDDMADAMRTFSLQ